MRTSRSKGQDSSRWENSVNRSRSIKTVDTEIIRQKLWNYGYYGSEKINIKYKTVAGNWKLWRVTQCIKVYILELTSTIEIKSTMNEFNSRLDKTDKKIGELDDMMEEINHN